MSTNHTENYSLSQWEAGDKVLRTEFNEDNAKIDEALKAEADARSSAVASLTAQVTAKAEQTALNALSAQVAKLGNCQVWTSTYKGAGGYGKDHPTSITFPKKPLLAIVISGGYSALMPPQDGIMSVNASNYYFFNRLTWSDSIASWYCTDSNSDYAQLDAKNNVYYVIAFLAMDS